MEVAPLHYEAAEGNLRLVFRENQAGDIVYMNISNSPVVTFRRMAWYETMSFNLLLLAACAVLFLLVLLVEPLRLLIGWLKRRTQRRQPAMARLARGMVVALAILVLTMLSGLYWQIVENYTGIVMGQRGMLTVLGGISLLIVALAGGTVILSVQAWRHGWWGIMGRIYYSLVTFAAILFVSFLAFWNQIGWQWW